jgi:hypothetical protein
MDGIEEVEVNMPGTMNSRIAWVACALILAACGGSSPAPFGGDGGTDE